LEAKRDEWKVEEMVAGSVQMMAVSLAGGKADKKVVLLVYTTVYLMVESLAVMWAGLRDERWVGESDNPMVGMLVASKVG